MDVASLGAEEAALLAESNVLSQKAAAKAVAKLYPQGESRWGAGSWST